MKLEPQIHALLSRPNFAHLSTLMPDGSPNNSPVWIDVQDDRILISSEESSLKVRNLRHDSRVAVSVVDFHDPYEEVQIRGRAIEIRDDSTFEFLNHISHKYIGQNYPDRALEGVVVLVIEADKVRYAKLPFEHTPSKGGIAS
ncbi:MAG TPA: PPOX class F420-dependent oxidoreductase [Terriglobales bacterium]